MTRTQTDHIDTSCPVLYRYDDGRELRNATDAELQESVAAGPEGVITVEIDGEAVDCYVVE